MELSLWVSFIFLGETFVLTDYDGCFKTVVSRYEIFLSWSLMWNFITSSTFMNLYWITLHSIMIDMFDLSSFVTPSSSKRSIVQWVQTPSIRIGFSSLIFFDIKQAHGIPNLFWSVHAHFDLSKPVLSTHLASWQIKFNVIEICCQPIVNKGCCL